MIESLRVVCVHDTARTHQVYLTQRRTVVLIADRDKCRQQPAAAAVKHYRYGL